MNIFQKTLALLLSWSLVIGAAPAAGAYVKQSVQSEAQPANTSTTQSPEELQQLVAPVALYPDALVSQILAAATYPTEIVEANRWMQGRPNLKGQELANEVDKQPWDPSVKALTQFPSVLANMDKNLSWTSSLGDVYANQPQDVMDAVQVMRARAQTAGNLKTDEHEKIETQANTIIIEPAEPEVVYVPTYDPWIVYGPPVVAWPGWYWYPGLYAPGPGIGFGLGFGLGFLTGFAWGWHHWGCDWGHRTVIYNHISHSTTIVNRNHFNRTTNNFNRSTNNVNGSSNNFNRNTNTVNHGQAGAQHGPSGQSGTHSGVFGGYNHGAVANGFSARGRSSFGGGGFHGGGRR